MREKVTAIIFTIFIFMMPIATLINDLIPVSVGEDATAKQVLEGNGTLANKESDQESATKVKASKLETINWSKDANPILRLKANVALFNKTLIGSDKFIAANDNFSYLISGKNYVQSTQVLVGKEDYLFFKTLSDGDPISDYEGTNLFTAEELGSIATNLINFRDKLGERGIDLYIMEVPNKEIVYSRYMPESIHRYSPVSRGQQLAEYIWANTDLNFIYPKDALTEASYDYQVYYKTDTHCTQIGAFVAFMEFYKMRYGMGQTLSDVSFKTEITDFSGDLATLLYLDDVKGRDSVPVFTGTTPEYVQPETILFVGDSMSGFQSNIAWSYFPMVYRIDIVDFSWDIVEEYQPDIVIFESVERSCIAFGYGK